MADKSLSGEKKFHVVKRTGIPVWRAWLIRIIAVFLALIVAGIFVMVVTKLNPIDVYKTMFDGAFGTGRKLWSLAQNTAILLCISLAVTPAFKMKFWNIGAEGQVMAGCIATATVMILLGGKMPTWALMIVMIVSSVLAGVVWGIIPAFFKAYWNTNETLFTLMMNYIAIQLASYLSTVWENPAGSAHIGIINSASKAGWLPMLFGKKYLLNIIIVAVITVALYLYFKFSKHGYEIAVVGESQNTARYVGMNVKKIIIRTMALSGALCGIAGLLIVAGTDHTLSSSSVGGQGFTAVMVSWLAKFNPFTMILTSGLIAALGKGASEIAQEFNLNDSIADIITGIIIFFIIGCEFFINYKIVRSNRVNSKIVKIQPENETAQSNITEGEKA